MSLAILRTLLAHPLTRNLALDDPATTTLRRRIIAEKPFLKRIYQEWYEAILAQLPAVAGPVLEIGSGPGFLKEMLPELITSELLPCPGVRMRLDGQRLPFARGALRAIVMTDVLHHVPGPERFFEEAARALTAGGRIVMIEPWVTSWSRFIYTHFHNEPFRCDATEWGFPASGPLSGANGAMPWLIFCRDRARFEAQFPSLAVAAIRPLMPFRYLLSGGVSMRSLVPGWTFTAWRGIERALEPFMDRLAMFALVVIERSG